MITYVPQIVQTVRPMAIVTPVEGYWLSFPSLL